MLSIYKSRIERAVEMLRDSWLGEYHIADNGEDNWGDLEPDVRNDVIDQASDHDVSACQMRVSEALWDEDAIDALWSDDAVESFYGWIRKCDAYQADQTMFEAVWYEFFEDDVHNWLMDNFEFDREPAIVVG